MPLNKILVIGSGTMGHGIAQWFSQSGCRVHLSDIDLDFAKSNLQKVHQSWDKLEKKGKFDGKKIKEFKENLTIVENDKWDKDYDLVIEAIVENLTIKKSLFVKLHEHMNKKTILASNTSSLSIDKMASSLPQDRQKRFVGMHFFNPAPIMKLVEIINGQNTDQEMVKNLLTWLKEKGKRPALCKDGPGFIVNRVARNFYGESLRIASTYDKNKILEIDSVLKDVGGFSMGPFTLMDLIGIDVNYAVTCSVWEAFYHEPRFAPHSLQRSMVDSGQLGKKSKRGFYNYE